jgi:hypothetical protein
MLAAVVMVGSAFEKDLADLASRHGLKSSAQLMTQPGGGFVQPDPSRMAELHAMAQNATVKNKRAFCVDALQFMSKKAREVQKEQKTTRTNLYATAKLSDLVIDGDTARAKVSASRDGHSMSATISFTRIDGSWLIDAPHLSFIHLNENNRPRPFGFPPR